MSLRTRLRRTWFGLSTVMGLKPRGFFIPYRYAAGVVPPDARTSYDAAETALEDARPALRTVIDAIGGYASEFVRIGAGAVDGVPRPAPRWDQAWFPPLDAAATYAIVRTRKPGRVVEIGSGHSTRFLVRAVHDGGLKTAITAIDPEPRATLEGLPVDWRRATLQSAGTGLASEIGAGDVLFIDSSHILMPGTDVDILFNRVLPALPRGAIVHIHDIFLPDDYPADWSWRGYNEQLALVPMLGGGDWRILFASRFVETRMADALETTPVPGLPNPERAPGSSLWLQKA